MARPGPLIPEFEAAGRTRVGRLDRRSPDQLAALGLRRIGGPALADGFLDLAIRARTAGHHADLTVVNGATAPTARLLRSVPDDRRTVMIVHELSTGWFGNISADDRRLLLDRCDRFLAVSRTVAGFLQGCLGVAKRDITVIPPIVDLDERAPTGERGATPGAPVVVGGAGMTDWRKAPELWLQVAARAVEMAEGTELRFIWYGGDRPGTVAGWPLQHETAHLGLTDRTRFLGTVTDPWPVLRDIDVFVSTAREDAAPLACAEAAACGAPIITFDTGGAAELVRDGRCGTVVPYPRVDELAEAVVALARDRDRRTELGRRGAQFVEQNQASTVVGAEVGAWLMEAIG